MHERRRPDPALGVFETMLVLDGRPVELDAHLARLRRSLRALYPAAAGADAVLPDVPGVTGPNAPSTPGTPPSPGAVRVTVAPGGDGELAVAVERRVLPDGVRLGEPAEPVALRSLAVAGGLGEHKWADRSLLGEAAATLGPGALPLILDADGCALEASRANLFALRDGVLRTPPLDGRILPGVTRARVLALARENGVATAEEPLAAAELGAAEEVFLTGSVRGIEPAAELDGAPLPGAGETARRLAAALLGAWRR